MQATSKASYKYWQEGEFWLGYLEVYPDYMPQGMSLEELKENLSDLYKDLTSGNIASIRSVGELEIK